MTWEWSHSPEAYTTLHARLRRMPHEQLAIIWGEWKASELGHFHPNGKPGDFEQRRYERGHAAAFSFAREELADKIYELAEKLSDCTNGGWKAHVCPYHCGPHSIAWSSEEKDEADAEYECVSCGEVIEPGRKVWFLADLPEEGHFCSRDHAQEHEHAVACEEIS